MDEKEFAIRLARLRERKGVSARDMSLSIGQNQGYINNIETGKSKPSLDAFFFICEFLGVTPAEFFDTEAQNPAKLNSIITDMKRLNEGQLDLIANLVKDLIKK
ncbi:MAG: helix-turn-helix transcriptional regulator [Clostridia bacterium]|nr:helix-turn-helix transcriptional regulator [Clostridia bacterium]